MVTFFIALIIKTSHGTLNGLLHYFAFYTRENERFLSRNIHKHNNIIIYKMRYQKEKEILYIITITSTLAYEHVLKFHILNN